MNLAGPIVDVTTVSDTEAVIHTTDHTGTATAHRFSDLSSGSTTTLHVAVTGEHNGTASVVAVDVEVTTQTRPSGALLCRFATVNDVHFGELAAGQIDDLPEGPVRRSAPGADPYPEVMNRAAVGEISEIDPVAVVVKGDLSLDGADDEFAAFEACYRTTFGDRLIVTRGNHDAYRHQRAYAGDHRADLPGVTLALLDTTIPASTSGGLDTTQLDWLNDVAASSDQPVFVMGHHQQWVHDPGDALEQRSDDYFGLHPDDSDLLDETCARHSNVIAYAAGHTHRHRRRTMTSSGIPTIEVGCTKDFPGTWAEYRVFEGGIMQVVHRMSSPEALAWSESCRTLYSDFGVDYSSYALGSLDDRCFSIPLRVDR